MVAKDNTNIAQLKKVLAENPELLREALSAMNAKPQGAPAVEIVGTEVKEMPIVKMNGTKIVSEGAVKKTFYKVRTLKGDIVSIPEHCLKDYGLSPKVKAKYVDEDGLSSEEKSAILNRGAY